MSAPITIDAWMLPVVPGAAADRTFIEVVGPSDARKISYLGHAADRDRAVSARVAARTVIGRRLGIPPARVPLVSNGRPLIVDTDATISWSHSGRWIALAIAQALPVGIDIEEMSGRLDPGVLTHVGVASLEEFVALEAASKATGCVHEWAQPPGVTARRLSAPQHYFAAVAAPGTEWKTELHMRSPLEEWTHRCTNR